MAKKILKGKIISHKMAKTAVVLVTRYVKHPKYKKYIKINKRYKVHDQNDQYASGDSVLIEESRPISKEKRFVIKEKV